MIPVVAGVLGGIANVIAGSVARFIALKTLLIGLFMVVLPFVLHGIIFYFMERGLQYINGVDSVSPAVVELTSFGAWIAVKLQLPLCLSIVLGAVSTRLTLKVLRVV